ncbi:MAG: exosome complex RNA-binding protein Rrp4 [Desulfurococcales archaeon]|jgi:exosome complex component RRP4|nr:exosome complex RNA-binding protein Rrp4 [Desulfurococcales archaeon]
MSGGSPQHGGSIYVKHREIVLPGDLVASGGVNVDRYPYAYCLGDKCYSTVIGVAEERGENSIRIVPLEGFYNPQEEDIVIGIVEEVGITSAILDIRAPYKGVLPASEIVSKHYSPVQEPLINYVSPGDIYLAKIEKFDMTRDPLLSLKGKDLGRIVDGVIIEVVPTRVPRVIGKKRSMIDMLTKETQCQIVPAANGRILIRGCPSGDHEAIAINAIKLIENAPYIQGLTEKIREYLVVEKVRRGLVRGEG